MTHQEQIPQLRSAASVDSRFAYEVKRAAFKEYVDQVWGWNEEEQQELHSRRFSSQEVHIIQLGDEDVGFLAVSRDEESVRLHQMFILPEYQSQGIGHHCVLAILEDARLHDIPVRLQVLRTNPRALTFYERLGFAIIGETELHFLLESNEQLSPT